MTAIKHHKKRNSPSPSDDGLSLGRRAYEQLREAIETGKLKPGSPVRETDLATQLDMSRTPIQRAITWLEGDGLIAHEPYRGRVIARLDYQMVIELYVIRLVLEPAGAALAARNASEVEISALRDMLELERELLGDSLRRERHNRLFHEAIYRGAHNRYLLNALNALYSPMLLLGHATEMDPSRLQTAYGEHREMVAAIERRDAEAAEAVMREHLKRGQKVRVEAMLKRLSQRGESTKQQ
ncbi:MAG TPA: GntR family transcriptional regulator [Burkholderiales bacterium]|nr:GntR family transcriptional regulator [Burkholderiales bacterium]